MKGGGLKKKERPNIDISSWEWDRFDRCSPAGPLTTLEPQDQEISEFWGVVRSSKGVKRSVGI